MHSVSDLGTEVLAGAKRLVAYGHSLRMESVPENGAFVWF